MYRHVQLRQWKLHTDRYVYRNVCYACYEYVSTKKSASIIYSQLCQLAHEFIQQWLSVIRFL